MSATPAGGVAGLSSDLIRLRGRDPDAAAAWHDRMDELLAGFRLLARGFKREEALASCWSAQRAADYLWAGSSVQAWELLAIERGGGPAAASRTIRRTLAGAVLA